VKRLAALSIVALAAAVATPSAADPAPRARAITRLDDARTCVPLANGGFAVGTGGGLAMIAKDGGVKTLTSIDGLPETRVHSVVESGDGLWVGTEGGAAFVSSGRVARTVGNQPVQSVYVASNGAIYLGTRGAGVFRLATRESAPELLRNTTKGTRVAAIAERGGVVHVAYSDGSLARVDGNALVAIDGSPTHGQALASVGAALLLGDLEGLYRVDGNTFTQLASVDARGIAPASGDTIAVATYGGGLQTGSLRGALHADGSVAKLARGVGVRGASRCVATEDGVYLDEGKGTFHKQALGGPSSNDVTALVVSASGKIAIGTFESGAQSYEGGAWKRVPGVDPHETVNGMAWQGERMWLATAHGIVRVGADGSARRFTSHDGLPTTFSRSVAVVSNDRVVVGTDSGPAIIEGDRVVAVEDTKKGALRALASPMHAAYSVAAGSDGTLYIGTTSGLYFGKDGTFARASVATGELEDDWVTSIAVDGSDVFVGTYAKGVTHLHFENGKPKATQLGGGYVNDDGLTIANGMIYAATMEHVLVRPKNDDAAKWESRATLSPGRDVTAVRFVGTDTWVASRRGIAVTAK
jgi:hypothetical protein